MQKPKQEIILNKNFQVKFLKNPKLKTDKKVRGKSGKEGYERNNKENSND